MKNTIIASIIVLLFGCNLNAQDISKNALGLRLGDSNGFGTEISYQRGLSENNRLEFDLGWRDSKDYDGFKLAVLYQWVWNIDAGFNWYAGFGGGLGSYDFNDNHGNDSTDTFVFAAGDIGIEYNFDIPLIISLDFRPEIGFGDETYDNNDLDFDIGFGIRYQF
jgi:outer membrane phospholipase A